MSASPDTSARQAGTAPGQFDESVEKVIKRCIAAVSLKTPHKFTLDDPIIALPIIENEICNLWKNSTREMMQEYVQGYEQFSQTLRLDCRKNAEQIINASIAATNEQIARTVEAGCGNIAETIRNEGAILAAMLKKDNKAVEKALSRMRVLCICGIVGGIASVAAAFWLVKTFA